MASIAYGAGRQALLDAAIHVVATEGLRGLTYRSVAAEAGVSHGSVQYHFGDWDTLVEQAHVHSVQRSIATAHLVTDGADLASFAVGLAASVTDDPETQAFQYELAVAARHRPSLMPVIERAYDAYRTAVADALTGHGLTDPVVADLVLAAIDGLVFQQTVFGQPERTERALAALRVLLVGAATEVGR